MASAAQKKLWNIMYAVPEVTDEISTKFPNASFTFNKVPLLSYLTVTSNVAIPARGAEPVDYLYIAAADGSGVLLLCGYTLIGLTYYLCDPCFRPPDGGFNSRRTVGFIRHGDKRVMVAQLSSWLLEGRRRVELSCTVNMCTWVAKELDCEHIADAEPWLCGGVLSHEGFLWWFDLSSCILACDPLEDNPGLYQIQFPHVPDTLRLTSFPFYRDPHRCFKASQGRLRFVQIHGDSAGQKPVVSMWTLSSNNPADTAWELTHKVPLAEIWNHRTYKSKPLPEEVPTVVLVHPMKAHKVYFFLGQHIFRVNLKKMSVRQCRELDNQGLPALTSLMVHAWQLPIRATENNLHEPDDFHLPGGHFLTRYDSVDDFLDKALDVIIRSCPELFSMGSEELEEEDDDSDDGDFHLIKGDMFLR